MNFIASRLGSSSAKVLGFEIYGSDPPAPIVWLYRLLHKADRLKWAAYHRWHPRHRYFMVNTGLAPGYHDQDERILHACMAMLCEYVECRHGSADELEAHVAELRASPDPNAPDGLCETSADMEDGALAIYRWWKVERPANHQRLSDWLDCLYGLARFESWVGDDGGKRCGFRGKRDESMGTMEQYWEYEQQLDADDQRMLHKLVDIRRGLWT